MKVLKVIGGFFAKIWRWIKNTAWVQPLLIVGVIFGVIFSIPSIVSGIQGLVNNNNSAEAFFNGYMKSMEGGKTSSAETLLENYKEHQSSIKNIDAKDEEKINAYLNTIPENEKKYFLYFTAKGNSTVNDTKEAFEIAKNNWGNRLTIKDNRSFNLYTIVTSEETSATTKEKTAFSQLLDRQSKFFELASEAGYKTQYYINGKITNEQLDKLCNGEEADFSVPTLILVDWSKNYKYEESSSNLLGVNQITFSLSGEDSWAKAQYLADCWNGDKDFDKK